MKYRILDILLFAGSYLLANSLLIRFFSMSQPYDGILAAIIAVIIGFLVRRFIPVNLIRKDKTE